MKFLTSFFICWILSFQLYSQVHGGNLTATWTENEKDFYILNDNTTPDDVNQVDRAQMQPKVYLQDVGYKWVNGAFAERSVTIRNYLGSDEYFSFPPSTIKYSPNGAVSRYDLNGNYIEQVSQPNAQLAADLVNSKIQNVSPVYLKPANYSFVPHLSVAQLDSLANAGYSVVNNYPEYLKIEGPTQKIIFDNSTKTRSYVLLDGKANVASLQTEYFVEDNNMVYKTRSLSQSNVTLVSGLCVMKAKEILYSAYNLITTGNNNFLSRQSEQVVTESVAPVSIFPNPASAGFTLSINDNKYMPANVKLYDINGQSVPFTTTTDALGNINIMPQTNTSGMLILSYDLNKKHYTQKVLKF